MYRTPTMPFCPFFQRPAAWPHTHHVHLVRSGGVKERQTLAFRDCLREHPEVVRAYERLKRELARGTARRPSTGARPTPTRRPRSSGGSRSRRSLTAFRGSFEPRRPVSGRSQAAIRCPLGGRLAAWRATRQPGGATCDAAFAGRRVSVRTRRSGTAVRPAAGPVAHGARAGDPGRDRRRRSPS